MSSIRHVTRQTFNSEVLQSPVPVLLDFYADWCGPCRMLAPTLERLAAEFAGRVRIAKVNVDTEPELADQFSISAIPTLAVMVNGREVTRSNGLVGETALRQALTELSPHAQPRQQVD